MKLYKLADLSDVWATIYVPQTMLAKLKLGMPLEASLPELKGKKIDGKVKHIRDEAEFTPRNVQTREERTRLVYAVKVALPNADRLLKPGMTVEVKLPE
jgi:HlyD family secretion protein